MSAPLSTTGASPGPQAWLELEDVFSQLSQFARSPLAPHEFYRTALQESVRALSAAGGAVWLRGADGAMQPLLQFGWPSAAFARDEAARREHEAALSRAAAQRSILTIPPGTAENADNAANPTEHMLLIAPVRRVASLDEDGKASATQAIVEVLLRADASPATHRGYEQFLSALCELAAEYHAFDDLRRLRQDAWYRDQLLRLSRDVQRDLRLADTAYTVANESRRVLDCDRLSVLVKRGRGSRLLSISGVSRAERRSSAVRQLERLATLVCQTAEPAIYDDGQCDALPPVAEALEAHADEAHARQILAIPLRPITDAARDEDADASDHDSRQARPLFVLVAEQFDASPGDLDRERLVEVGDICAGALHNAWNYDQLPFSWLLRPLGVAKQQVTAHLPRTVIVLAAIAAAIAALMVVPADFNVEATGSLQPVVRREVFAPRSGVVDEVLVAHGADVVAGQPLLKLHDPALELEIKRVDGELETAQRQLDAVRATRTNRAVRDANPADVYRLSAEERQLEQRLTNWRRELELLDRERQQLLVTSPISGRVLTWDIGDRLAARPVDRGDVLLTVGDLSAEWQLELDVPDDRMGYVRAAQRAIAAELPVRFRLSSDDSGQHVGRIAEVHQIADVRPAEGTMPRPTVLVKVAFDSAALAEVAKEDLRPGVSARAQIPCGQRTLGFVWLHELWDAAVEWMSY